MTSSAASKKSRGRPATGIGHQVVVRMHDPMLTALDAFAADQPEPAPGRPEAVRRALADHLRAKGLSAGSGRRGGLTMCHGSAVWLPFVQPFGTVFLGIGAFCIAYLQWRTATEKLKIDLWDKRTLLIDEAIKDYLELFRHGRQDQGSLKSLHYRLTRLATVFEGQAKTIAIRSLNDVAGLLSVRETDKNGNELEKRFEAIVEAIPELQKHALREMALKMPRLVPLSRPFKVL